DLGDQGNVIAASGSVSVIRISDAVAAGVEHARTGVTRIPWRPTAAAMRPDGRLIAAASAARTEQGAGRLMLVRFNSITGESRIATETADGPAPAGLAFDPDGSHLAVADLVNSEAQVWRVIESGDSFGLEYTGLNVGLGDHPHAILIAPRR
ncbi:MAG: hypothetical protein VYC34_08780, partial [Planctomycetota bacterium]|nr:hypothetical protein [Planctomycetota bacterium]